MNKSTNPWDSEESEMDALKKAQPASMSLPKRVAYFLGRQFLFAEMSLCSKCKNGLPPVWTTILIVMGISLAASIITSNVWDNRNYVAVLLVSYVFLMVCYLFSNPPQCDDDRLFFEMPPRKRRMWKLCTWAVVAVCWSIILYTYVDVISDIYFQEDW